MHTMPFRYIFYILKEICRSYRKTKSLRNNFFKFYREMLFVIKFIFTKTFSLLILNIPYFLLFNKNLYKHYKEFLYNIWTFCTILVCLKSEGRAYFIKKTLLDFMFYVTATFCNAGILFICSWTENIWITY